MLTLWFVTDWINEGFHSFLLLIDAVVYWFVSVCYNLFVFLATKPIFKEEFFTDFARRIYAILGVFMLFYFLDTYIYIVYILMKRRLMLKRKNRK